MAKARKKAIPSSEESAIAEVEENVMEEAKPEDIPPMEDAAMAGEEEARPEAMLPEEESSSFDVSGAMPSDLPPGEESDEEDAFGAAFWHRNKKITGLWSINQNCNSWIAIHGIGWRRLASNSTSAVVALTMLASHAKQLGRNVNCLEDGGRITQIYVW